ncbi:hypothetical protein LXL04_038042 [Taraxacum kok-saghyz]
MVSGKKHKSELHPRGTPSSQWPNGSKEQNNCAWLENKARKLFQELGRRASERPLGVKDHGTDGNQGYSLQLAVIPIEVSLPSARTEFIVTEINDASLRANPDMVEERRRDA